MISDTRVVPLNFVCPDDEVWPELRSNKIAEIEPQRLSQLSTGVLNSWVVRTYYELLIRDQDVRISSRPHENYINIVSVRDFGRRQRDIRSFVVVPRADAHFPMLANFVINQNGLRGETFSTASLPHWPQPGIVKRNPARPPGISQICYKGDPVNLDSKFRSKEFKNSLSGLGVKLEIDEIYTNTGGHSWNNYINSDAVLAVRNMTRYDAAKKPASKLINAWISGTIPILGPEPAFNELRRSELDYIVVRTPEDVMAAILDLNQNPRKFEAIVMNGIRRSDEFSCDKIAARWISLMQGKVADIYHRWKRTWLPYKAFIYASAILSEPGSKALDRHRYLNGARILDNA